MKIKNLNRRKAQHFFSMKKFEYWVCFSGHGKYAEIEDLINGYGQEGWELVNAIPINDRVMFIFKRLKG